MNKKILIVLTIIVMIVNTCVIYFFSVEEKKITRLCSILLYIIFFIVYKGFSKSKIIFGALLLMLVSDMLVFNVENRIASKLLYILRLIGYLLIIVIAFKKIKKIKKEKIKPHVFIVALLVIAINLYLVYATAESATKTISDAFEYGLILIYGAVLIISISMATLYNVNYISFRSAYFFFYVLLLSLSDLCWFLAQSFNYTPLFYADLIFYYLSLFCIVSYAINTKDSEDILLSEDWD